VVVSGLLMRVIMITASNPHELRRTLPLIATASPTPHSSPKRQQRGGVLAWLLGILAVLVVAAAAAAVLGLRWWAQQPLPLAAPSVELSVEQGQTPRTVAQAWVQAGVQTSPWMLYQWFRWSGQARGIKAGSYEITQGITAARLLSMMVQGDESLSGVKLIEGWTFKRWRQELAKADGLKPDTQGMTEAQIMAALGAEGLPAEGQFFPDTYAYAKGSSDLAVMRRAHRAMARHLALVWDQRHSDTPLQDMQQALILASIVEKETGSPADRPDIAAVFINRLRIRMPLQTDPTVIYGMGDAFDGNLRKVHLQTDTPFNTYTRQGLPPTPIAMPGKAALMAAVRPSGSKALYFVARGDGSSQFSETLVEHNRAVNRYQRQRP
jgi:UPF0755 protein